MPRKLHRWTDPHRPSAELSIRSCIRCGLVQHSHHQWDNRGGTHWKTYYSIDAPDFEMTVMPECVRETEEVG